MVKTAKIFLITLKSLLSRKWSLKTASKRAIQKNEEATGDLIGHNIANKITKVSIYSPQKSSETVESQAGKIGFDRWIPKEGYIYLQKKDWNYWWSKINVYNI